MAATVALVLLLAVIVRAEWLLFGAAGEAGPTWRGAILLLVALLFVPAIAAAALLLSALRRRKGPSAKSRIGPSERVFDA